MAGFYWPEFEIRLNRSLIVWNHRQTVPEYKAVPNVKDGPLSYQRIGVLTTVQQVSVGGMKHVHHLINGWSKQWSEPSADEPILN